MKLFLLKVYILYLKLFFVGKDTKINNCYYGQTC